MADNKKAMLSQGDHMVLHKFLWWAGVFWNRMRNDRSKSSNQKHVCNLLRDPGSVLLRFRDIAGFMWKI